MMTGDYFFKEEPKPKEIEVPVDEKENNDRLFKHPGDVLSAVNVNVRVDNWLHDQLGIDF